MKIARGLAFGISAAWWRMGTALVLAGSLSGCLVIPLNTDSGKARTNIERDTSEQFVTGRTTRAEVILALGEPDAVSKDEQQLAYRTEKIVAVWILAGAGYYSAGGTAGEVLKSRFLVFEFDPRGVYQSARRSGQWQITESEHGPLLKSPGAEFARSNHTPVANALELARKEYPKSFWLPGVDGYRNASVALVGLPGRLFCSESNLAFVTESQFANSRPELELPYVSLSEVRVDRYAFARRLVVRLKTGEVHSFDIHKPRKTVQGKTAIQALCEFIDSSIRTSSPER